MATQQTEIDLGELGDQIRRSIDANMESWGAGVKDGILYSSLAVRSEFEAIKHMIEAGIVKTGEEILQVLAIRIPIAFETLQSWQPTTPAHLARK